MYALSITCGAQDVPHKKISKAHQLSVTKGHLVYSGSQAFILILHVYTYKSDPNLPEHIIVFVPEV